MSGVRIERGVLHIVIECDRCKYHESASGSTDVGSARVRARRHAKATDHAVRLEQSVVTYLNPKR